MPINKTLCSNSPLYSQMQHMQLTHQLPPSSLWGNASAADKMSSVNNVSMKDAGLCINYGGAGAKECLKSSCNLPVSTKSFFPCVSAQSTSAGGHGRRRLLREQQPCRGRRAGRVDVLEGRRRVPLIRRES